MLLFSVPLECGHKLTKWQKRIGNQGSYTLWLNYSRLPFHPWSVPNFFVGPCHWLSPSLIVCSPSRQNYRRGQRCIIFRMKFIWSWVWIESYSWIRYSISPSPGSSMNDKSLWECQIMEDGETKLWYTAHQLVYDVQILSYAVVVCQLVEPVAGSEHEEPTTYAHIIAGIMYLLQDLLNIRHICSCMQFLLMLSSFLECAVKACIPLSLTQTL